jgi:hypothetical protein
MSNNKIQRESLRLFLGLVIVVAVLEVASAVIIYDFFRDWNSASNFGETFGGVNSLFSGWALAGIVYTLWLQKKTLEEQRAQFLKADADSLRSQTDRAKTHEMLYKQVEALNRAVEIQAIQLHIQYLAEQIKISNEKTKLTRQKEFYYDKLRTLLENERADSGLTHH